MNLKETVELMTSDNHVDRFKAEYYQLEIRRDRLKTMLNLWDKNKLHFSPKTPRTLLQIQLYQMNNLLCTLQERAIYEGIDLQCTPEG